MMPEIKKKNRGPSFCTGTFAEAIVKANSSGESGRFRPMGASRKNAKAFLQSLAKEAGDVDEQGFFLHHVEDLFRDAELRKELKAIRASHKREGLPNHL